MLEHVEAVRLYVRHFNVVYLAVLYTDVLGDGFLAL